MRTGVAIQTSNYVRDNVIQTTIHKIKGDS